MNWKLRIKHPWFWIGLVGVFLSSVGVDAETLTSWGTIVVMLKAFVMNPFKIGTFIVAVVGIFVDPTTSGLCDSAEAMSYVEPKK
jgi:phi LC3 family holin